ncbi:potassium transporter TrkA [Candidatus Fermentibacteria bacterium]|nr:MAG: potassium transporter TrkA [Candidatus Fermentibacteria bacterium]
MKRDFSLKNRLSYAFDTMMSRGTAGLIIWLGIVTAILIVVFSAIIFASGTAPDNEGFPTLLWMSLMRTMDPGTIGGDEGSPGFLLSMLIVTFSGIFIFSTLIGILTTGLEAKLEALRKGRSRVIEQGHTVVLGWSEQVFTIVSELSIANENQKKPCVAIMADKDKLEMEDELREKVPETRNTKIVCRTGSPVETADLEKMSLQTTKSIIILSPDSSNPDPEVIKTMLAITNLTADAEDPVHMVALITDPANVQAARIVGGSQAEIVLAGDVIARMAAQTCLQSGLSVVYQELLDYGGDEIYFTEEPRLAGRKLHEALMAYETSSIIGIHKNGMTPTLNPPLDTVIEPGDRLIAISEDDDTVILSEKEAPETMDSCIIHNDERSGGPERIIMLGWNWRAPIIIRELGNYLQIGSTLKIMADESICRPLPPQGTAKLSVEYIPGKTTDRAVLEGLSAERFDHILILSYSDNLEPQEADSNTLMTLLHIRDIAEKMGREFSIITEMRDIRNRNLAEITGADDYIVSDQFLSLLLTQISETKELSSVFWNLFDPAGSEIYLKPVSRYVKTDEKLNFYTIVKSAAQLGETAIGYRIAAQKNSSADNYGIKVNPPKNQLLSFSRDDMIIVLAED